MSASRFVAPYFLLNGALILQYALFREYHTYSYAMEPMGSLGLTWVRAPDLPLAPPPLPLLFL